MLASNSGGDLAAAPATKGLVQWNRTVAKGLQLAPLLVSCGLPKPAKALLSDSRATSAVVEGQDPVPEPTFNPAAPEYNELPLRMAQSQAMQTIKHLKDKIKKLQARPASAAEGNEAAQVEESTAKLAEVEGQLSELRASFESDPLALAPWTCSLFSLADAGLTSYAVGAPAWPYMDARQMLGPAAAAPGAPPGSTAGLTRGGDQVVGTFKRRFELERGLNSLQVVGRWAPNCFVEGFNPAALVEGAVDGLRELLLGPEAAAGGAPLDVLLLHWPDYVGRDVMPVLRALGGLLRPRVPAGEEEGAVPAPAKLRALGLVEPPLEVLTAAKHAGVPITVVQLRYSLADTAAAPLVAHCRDKGITVLATGTLLSGLLSEAWVGCAPPGAGAVGAGGALVEGGEPLAAGLDAVRRLGGWPRFQELLVLLSTIAGRERTSIQGVALRWLADQDLIPQICPLGWDKACNKMWAATLGIHPAAGARQRSEWLRQVVGHGAGSFLTPADVKALAEFTASSK